MATVATKEAMAYQMQENRLGHGPHVPTPLYLDATAVLHGTATEQVSREMKYLTAKLPVVQQARALDPLERAGRRRCHRCRRYHRRHFQETPH